MRQLPIPRVINAAVLAVGLMASVAGCAGLLDSDEPAERIYWLDPHVVPEPDVDNRTQTSLSVSVVAAPGMDTDRLLVLEPDSRLNHIASARWPDNIPDVIQSHLQTTLQSSGRYTRVTAGPTSRVAHRRLELEIREIYSVADQDNRASVVRMALGGYVSCSETDDPIALAADIDINDDRLSGIVAAYQVALNEISLQLLRQLSMSCLPEAQDAIDHR